MDPQSSASWQSQRPLRREDASRLTTFDLNEREEFILRAIVQSYVLSASPIGSQTLLRHIESEMKVSSATIRTVMARLEELGYITHPHTSAGRVPTDKGYRTYVDSLMMLDLLSADEEHKLKKSLLASTSESIHRDASRILGMVSQLLGVVQVPVVGDLIIRQIQLIPLSSIRVLVVVALDSDIVRTLSLETEGVIHTQELEALARVLNERVSGRSLRFVREHFPAMMAEHTSHPVVRLFIDSMERLLSDGSERLHMAGAQNLVHQPEFEDPSRLRGVVELIENEDVIVHLLERTQSEVDNSVNVMIGSETQSDLLRDFSFVSAHYRVGSSTYSVGLIGPKRMNYARLMSLVGSVASMMTHVHAGDQ